MVAVARENSDAIKVGCSGAESFACAFHMVRS